jgi:hypothetical protein
MLFWSPSSHQTGKPMLRGDGGAGLRGERALPVPRSMRSAA